MDKSHPPMTSQLILDKLKKESSFESTLKDLTNRMTSVEANLQLVMQNQITQAELLSKLLSTQYGGASWSLDDNKKGEKEKETQQISDQQIKKPQKISDQQIKKPQQIYDQQIKKPQQISGQQIISGKRKSSSTSDQPTSKRQYQGLDAIEERRRTREAQTKDLAEKEKMQLAELQRKTKEAISAVAKGTIIQTESDVDSRCLKYKGVWISTRCKSIWNKFTNFPISSKAQRKKSISRRHLS